MKNTRTVKVIITVFHKFKKLSGDMEDINEIKIKFPKVKTMISEMKNMQEKINGGLDMAVEKNSELEDMAIETI